MSHTDSNDRVDGIQLLRAIAAIAVVTHHIPLFGNGAWGVDIFFVISGFIMCYVTEKSAQGFFLKRIIRIVPLYWAGTIGIFCVALVAPQLLGNTTPAGIDLLKSLAFIPYQKGAEIQPMLFLGWTLNYEMFFYLLFALCMTISHQHRALLTSSLLLAIAAIGYAVPFESVPLKFFTGSIIIEFAFGMLSYLLFKRISASGPLAPSQRFIWTSIGGLIIICMPLFVVHLPIESRVILCGIPAAVAFFCVVYGLAGLTLPIAFIIIGDASYSLYLFHPYVIQVFDKIFHVFASQDAKAYFFGVMLVFLCCGLSIISYKFFEKPLTDFLRRKLVYRQ